MAFGLKKPGLTPMKSIGPSSAIKIKRPKAHMMKPMLKSPKIKGLMPHKFEHNGRS